MKTEIKYNPAFESKLNEILAEKMKKLSELILEESKTIVPIDTGLLKSKLKILKQTDKMARIGTEGSQYAKFVEMGTVKQDSQPYLRNAVDNVLNRLNK